MAETARRRSGPRIVDVITAAALVALLIGVASWLRGETVTGDAFAIDGDTLALGGRRIRLRGLDAPELAQPCERNGTAWRCGEAARDAMRALVSRRSLDCTLRGRDRYDRALGSCTADGQDLGGALVRQGLAVAYGAYEAEERAARSERIGLWAGAFERPAEWRRRHAEAHRR